MLLSYRNQSFDLLHQLIVYCLDINGPTVTTSGFLRKALMFFADAFQDFCSGVSSLLKRSPLLKRASGKL